MDVVHYENRNINITKDIIFEKIKLLSDYIIKDIIELHNQSQKFKEIIKILYYLDEKYYKELFVLFFISLPSEIISYSPELLEIQNIYMENNLIRNEINCMRNICGTLYFK